MNFKLTEMLLENLYNNYYKEAEEKCMQQWGRICDLEVNSNKTEAEEDELSTLKCCFTLLLSANYQMLPILG